jgi:hypothetical protein
MMLAKTPTAGEQQFLETINNNGRQIKVNKKFVGVDLDRFDLELTDKHFQQAFPKSEQIRKNSASPTKVYKTTIVGRPYYVKSFELPTRRRPLRFNGEDPTGALLYEKEVYAYLRSKAVRDKEIRKHFIQMLLSAVDRSANRGYIFTQDTGGVPLYLLAESKDSLKKYFKDTDHGITADFVANIFTQLLHVISLMEKIGLVHNDLHFGNVLVVKDDVPTKTYTIYGQSFVVRNHPYSLVVYDFDMGSILTAPENENPFREGICREYGRCKDFQSTDKYVWLVHLLSSPEMWLFKNLSEKSKYNKIVSVFKEKFKGKTSGIFGWLFAKKTPQQAAIKAIQSKIDLYKKKGDSVSDPYPPPIFHASCKFDTYVDECTTLFKPIDGAVLAEAWRGATRATTQNRQQQQVSGA